MILDKKLEASLDISCSAEMIFEILADYDNHFEWLNMLHHSRLLAREGDLALAEIETEAGRMTMEVIQNTNREVLMRKINGPTCLHQVRWLISTTDAEASNVSVEIILHRTWRNPLAKLENWDPEGMLRCLESRIATFAASFPLASESGVKVLEIIESEQGLVFWIMGRKYLLTPMEGDEDDQVSD